MATNKERDMEHPKGHLAMNTPPIVSPEEWEAARQQLLVKEKALTRSRLNRHRLYRKNARVAALRWNQITGVNPYNTVRQFCRAQIAKRGLLRKVFSRNVVSAVDDFSRPAILEMSV